LDEQRGPFGSVVELAPRMAVNIDGLMANYGQALKKGHTP
jgi:hypothetical protein